MARGRLIVHAGAPKCGSSSLQATLSARPDFTGRDGERFRYVAIGTDGGVLSGDALRGHAARQPCRYVSSFPIDMGAPMAAPAIERAAAALNALLAESSVVVSNEGWFDWVGQIGRIGLFARLDARVETIAYFRPQAEYLNAAWWQWGAWSGEPFADWLAHHDGTSFRWALKGYFWSLIDGVDAVRPRLLDGDVAADFLGLLGCEPVAAIPLNRSLPAPLLRFLQRNPRLRRDRHDPRYDFLLARTLPGWRGRAPWVLPIAEVARIVAACRADNLSLRDMLPADHGVAMAADPRWWDAACYADRPVEPADPPPVDAAEADAIAVALAEALREATDALDAPRAG